MRPLICAKSYSYPFTDRTLLQVDLSKVWISFSSIIVASSFIFSKAISDVFLSVIFLFVVHPYDVGDGIMIGQDLHYVS